MAPAYLIRAGAVSLLVDCGSGASTSLFRAGVGPEGLGGLALTHLHPDHSADLLPLLFALVNPVQPRRESELPIWGPEGLNQRLTGLEEVYGRWVRPDCGVTLSELGDGDRFQLGPLTAIAFRVQHSRRSLAYRFESAGAALCLSGDSGPCPGLVEAAGGVDLFICECSALEGEELAGHLTATQVGEIAAEAGCSRLVLTHLYEHVVRSDPLARVGARYAGPVELAEDGMVLEITPSSG
jgi:ribonuclease BN (tRNA processing enzyme)